MSRSAVDANAFDRIALPFTAVVFLLFAEEHLETMRPRLREHFEQELSQAVASEMRGELDPAWNHLERAHILSQAHAGPHIQVHWKMITFAWRTRDVRELLGQLPRILLAGPGSLLGRAPLGNTGGTDVGIFTPMPIPQDLESLLRDP